MIFVSEATFVNVILRFKRRFSNAPPGSFLAECHRAALTDYSSQYVQARDTYLEAAKALKMATGPYKASRDAYVAAGVNPVFLSCVPSENVNIITTVSTAVLLT